MKAKDDRNNWAALSNVFSAPTEDTLPPAAIGDLGTATGSAAGRPKGKGWKQRVA